MKNQKIRSNLIKTDNEIELMRISGRICAETFKKILENVKIGATCLLLNKIADSEIIKRGASPSFASVDNYNWSICTTVNDQVVHGIPNEKIIKDGDILGIDMGVSYKGYHSDMAVTVGIGGLSDTTRKFLAVGKEALKDAISQAKIGARIGDISAAIQQKVEGAGYSIVKSLTGHGIGRYLHEQPMIPGFGQKGTGPKIFENMTLAIEVIYNQGSGDVVLEKDGWTIRSADGSLGGLFEQTIVITKGGPIVLTPYL